MQQALNNHKTLYLQNVSKLLFTLLFLLTCVFAQAKVWSADDVPMVHLQDANRYVIQM